jgi:hypothetical protein
MVLVCAVTIAQTTYTQRAALAAPRRGWKMRMVLGRNYFLRQAAALLEAAQLTDDPHKAAELIQKAADLLVTVAELSAPDDPGSELH